MRTAPSIDRGIESRGNDSPRRRAGIVAAVLWAAVAGCTDNGSSVTDAGTDTGDPIPLTAVDLLVVVDDGREDLAQEQAILAHGLFAFVDSAMDPLQSAPYAAVDDLRIAAASTNMGFSSNGVDNDEFWPDMVPAVCEGFGDDGRFQDVSAATVELLDGGLIDCPDLGDEAWAETTPSAPNVELAAAAACLAKQGTDGCGWEQQLASMARGLTRDDQQAFVRENALLAVVLMSEVDDCSMADGQAMFAEEEVADWAALKVSIACGAHPEHLFPTAHYFDVLSGLKQRPDEVAFVAIVGVPYGDQPGAAACQGYGDELGDCLAQDEMQLVPEENDVAWFYAPACTRSVGSTEVSSAEPARRFVELANGSFGADSYVYSICNADWTPAFDALGAMIAGKLTAQ